MTEKDQNMFRQTMEDVMAIHITEIRGEFNLLKQEVGFIKEQTTKTNGTVIRHDAEIRTLQMADSIHMVNCPNNEPVSKLMAVYNNWKVFGIAGLAVGALSIIGAIITIDNFKDWWVKEKTSINKDLNTVQSEAKKNSEQTKANTKNIDALDVEQAFQKSKNDK